MRVMVAEFVEMLRRFLGISGAVKGKEKRGRERGRKQKRGGKGRKGRKTENRGKKRQGNEKREGEKGGDGRKGSGEGGRIYTGTPQH